MNEVEKRFAQIAAALTRRPKVTLGTSKKKGFGSSALCVNDKIFAMVSSKGNFVVKLPADRVDALVAAGAGARFGPGHGRVMKEWFAADPKAAVNWLSLAEEALAFVSAKK
ncbi:MAG TPA: hypothetical protein VMI53_12260 [Opitutaceae bacterium]|nr:hypothetical protein [Opitutaceae bacterium]